MASFSDFKFLHDPGRRPFLALRCPQTSIGGPDGIATKGPKRSVHRVGAEAALIILVPTTARPTGRVQTALGVLPVFGSKS